MTDDMLVAQSEWLPQYAGEIAKAAKRLDDAVAAGKRVNLVETEGAARLHTKTVEEMGQQKAEARANAQAADKGKMTKSNA
jgi:alpha-galactosidase